MTIASAAASATPLRASRALPALLLPLALLLVAGLAGCASAPDPPTYSVADVTTDEYHAEADRLELAPGWSWPADPIPATYRGDEIRYEEGYGTQAADQYWFCSWAQQALAAPADSPARGEAVARLVELRDTYYFEVLHPQSKPYVERELSLAEQGRLRLVRTDVAQNCPAGDPA